ncbi:hypothetical protein LTR53_001481 [Teratosphaeriaceae sp. CCFEE 6253]|nr:hypothetical protein LTR53_001481 [Teratosphaeriaceae sp. CCFEE 6253]
MLMKVSVRQAAEQETAQASQLWASQIQVMLGLKPDPRQQIPCSENAKEMSPNGTDEVDYTMPALGASVLRPYDGADTVREPKTEKLAGCAPANNDCTKPLPAGPQHMVEPSRWGPDDICSNCAQDIHNKVRGVTKESCDFLARKHRGHARCSRCTIKTQHRQPHLQCNRAGRRGSTSSTLPPSNTRFQESGLTRGRPDYWRPPPSVPVSEYIPDAQSTARQPSRMRQHRHRSSSREQVTRGRQPVASTNAPHGPSIRQEQASERSGSLNFAYEDVQASINHLVTELHHESSGKLRALQGKLLTSETKLIQANTKIKELEHALVQTASALAVSTRSTDLAQKRSLGFMAERESGMSSGEVEVEGEEGRKKRACRSD